MGKTGCGGLINGFFLPDDFRLFFGALPVWGDLPLAVGFSDRFDICLFTVLFLVGFH
jgi:hypothetical protein